MKNNKETTIKLNISEAYTIAEALELRICEIEEMFEENKISNESKESFEATLAELNSVIEKFVNVINKEV